MGNINVIEGQTDTPDEKNRRQILYEIHDSPVGGHPVMKKTYLAISLQ